SRAAPSPGAIASDRTQTAPGPRVLVLFSDTGGGHRAAAKALAQAISQLDSEAAVAAADPLIGEGSAVVRRLAGLYSPLIPRSRPAWGALYHSSNQRPVFAGIRAVLGGHLPRLLPRQLREPAPAVALCD